VLGNALAHPLYRDVVINCAQATRGKISEETCQPLVTQDKHFGIEELYHGPSDRPPLRRTLFKKIFIDETA
jgi:hypothetical protein